MDGISHSVTGFVIEVLIITLTSFLFGLVFSAFQHKLRSPSSIASMACPSICLQIW